MGTVRQFFAGLKAASALVPCESCAGSGFSDKVNRHIWSMEPREKLCPVCNGRGWRVPDQEK